jgi:hypothetical protein
VPRARSVQIDDVNEARARRDETLDKCNRIGGAHDDTVEPSPLEPDSLLSEHVDRGYHLEAAPAMLSC